MIRMTTEEKEIDVLKDALQWSKVSKKRKTPIYTFILALGCLIVLCFFLLPSPEATVVKEQEQNQIHTDYRTSLHENLAQLKAMQAEKEEKKLEEQVERPLSNDTIQPSTLTTPLSKEILARQNAPTTMYSNPSLENNSESEPNASNDGTNVVEAKTIAHPEFTVASGEFLQAVLETSINSDLPGSIRAIISRPVYAYTGERSLIPSGSRLMGHYSSTVLQGQNRIMVIWNRIILPDGMTVQLNSPNTDSLGRAGQGADSMNSHFFSRFAESALLSVIGAGTATVGVSDQAQDNSAAQYRTAIAQSAQQSAQQSLQEGNQAIKPTLHIHQGTAINVFVTQGLSFYQVLKNKAIEGT